MLFTSAALSKGVWAQKLKLRPKAGHGLWLSALLPAALIVNFLRHPVPLEYKFNAVLSLGLVGQAWIVWQRWAKAAHSATTYHFYTLIAGGVTSVGLFLVSGQRSSILVIAGWPVLLGYGQLYSALLSNFPQSFTLGEASVIAQGLVLFLVNALILHLPRAVFYPVSFSADPLHCLTLIIENGVLWILLLILVLKFGHKLFKNVIVFGILFGCTVLGITLSPITDPVPLHCIIDFILQDQERILILLIFSGFIGLTLVIVQWQVHRNGSTSITIRKAFHVVIFGVFLIGFLYQVAFLYLASGVVFAIFLLLEAVRVAQIEYVAPILNQAVNAFVDDRDAGLIALTPIYLLIGCAVPLFLHPSSVSRYSDSAAWTLVPLLSGVLSVGIGDSFAGVVGSKWGRHKWRGSPKSIEGCAANVVSQVLTLAVLNHFGFVRIVTPIQQLIVLAGIIANAGIETKTDQVDNLIVPLVTFIIFSLI